MKHMKHLVMIAGALAVAAAGYMAYQHYYSAQEEVQVQSWLIGLGGSSDETGKGWAFGLGASEDGPVIGMGPYGNSKTRQKNSEEMMNKDEDEVKPVKKSSYAKKQNSKRHKKHSDEQDNVAIQSEDWAPYSPFPTLS